MSLLPEQPDNRPVRRRRWKAPLKVSAVFFVVLVCVLLLLLGGWERWMAREARLLAASTATSNMANALAQHADDTLRAADVTLFGIVNRLEQSGAIADGMDGLHGFFQDAVKELPQLHGLFVYDDQGRWMVHSTSKPFPDVNNADRDYFQYHRDHPDSGARIGVPIRSRSTNDWVIPLSRRIDHPDGRFAGVALATLKLSYFTDFYRTFDIGSAGTILLALDNGTMLVRLPFNDTVVGADVNHGPVMKEYRAKGPAGTAMLTARMDKVERLYSYRHLASYPLLVATAISKEDILVDWRAGTYRYCFVMILVVGAIALLGRRMIGQITLREVVEAELRETKKTLEMRNQSLATIALQDGLTGLANRRHFNLALESEMARAARESEPLGLVMLDVDFFKKYNDSYGHPAGDVCLRRIAEAIQASLKRGGDLACRYGGEEFSVLLPGTGVEGAREVAERIRKAVEELAMPHIGNASGVVTISGGYACHDPLAHETNATELVDAADKALYAAKAQGRNRVCGEGDTPEA